jgi:SAM-dependent methyltransferase
MALELSPGKVVASIPEQHAFYIELLDPRSGDSILDAGCGRGATLSAGVQAFPSARWHGVEVRLEPLKRTQLRPGAGARLALGDLRWLPYGDITFDAVLCRDVLECVPQPREAVTEMVRILQPGGRLLLSHWDWYTQLFNVADIGLSRRFVDLFAETQQDWMESFDPAMGRKLKGLATSAGTLELLGAGVVTLIESEWSEGRFGHEQSLAMAELLARRGKVSEEESSHWLEIVRNAANDGSYLYSVNHYWVLARRPQNLTA